MTSSLRTQSSTHSHPEDWWLVESRSDDTAVTPVWCQRAGSGLCGVWFGRPGDPQVWLVGCGLGAGSTAGKGCHGYHMIWLISLEMLHIDYQSVLWLDGFLSADCPDVSDCKHTAGVYCDQYDQSVWSMWSIRSCYHHHQTECSHDVQ